MRADFDAFWGTILTPFGRRLGRFYAVWLVTLFTEDERLCCGHHQLPQGGPIGWRRVAASPGSSSRHLDRVLRLSVGLWAALVPVVSSISRALIG